MQNLAIDYDFTLFPILAIDKDTKTAKEKARTWAHMWRSKAILPASR